MFVSKQKYWAPLLLILGSLAYIPLCASQKAHVFTGEEARIDRAINDFFANKNIDKKDTHPLKKYIEYHFLEDDDEPSQCAWFEGTKEEFLDWKDNLSQTILADFLSSQYGENINWTPLLNQIYNICKKPSQQHNAAHNNDNNRDTKPQADAQAPASYTYEGAKAAYKQAIKVAQEEIKDEKLLAMVTKYITGLLDVVPIPANDVDSKSLDEHYILMQESKDLRHIDLEDYWQRMLNLSSKCPNTVYTVASAILQRERMRKISTAPHLKGTWALTNPYMSTIILSATKYVISKKRSEENFALVFRLLDTTQYLYEHKFLKEKLMALLADPHNKAFKSMWQKIRSKIVSESTDDSEDEYDDDSCFSYPQCALQVFPLQYSSGNALSKDVVHNVIVFLAKPFKKSEAELDHLLLKVLLLHTSYDILTMLTPDYLYSQKLIPQTTRKIKARCLALQEMAKTYTTRQPSPTPPKEIITWKEANNVQVDHPRECLSVININLHTIFLWEQQERSLIFKDIKDLFLSEDPYTTSLLFSTIQQKAWYKDDSRLREMLCYNIVLSSKALPSSVCFQAAQQLLQDNPWWPTFVLIYDMLPNIRCTNDQLQWLTLIVHPCNAYSIPMLRNMEAKTNDDAYSSFDDKMGIQALWLVSGAYAEEQTTDVLNTLQKQLTEGITEPIVLKIVTQALIHGLGTPTVRSLKAYQSDEMKPYITQCEKDKEETLATYQSFKQQNDTLLSGYGRKHGPYDHPAFSSVLIAIGIFLAPRIH